MPAREWIKYTSLLLFTLARLMQRKQEPINSFESRLAAGRLWLRLRLCVFAFLCAVCDAAKQTSKAASSLRLDSHADALVAPQVTQFLHHLLKMEHNEFQFQCTYLRPGSMQISAVALAPWHPPHALYLLSCAQPAKRVYSDSSSIIETRFLYHDTFSVDREQNVIFLGVWFEPLKTNHSMLNLGGMKCCL